MEAKTITHDRHVYGPVPSRRLGRSLGIDLVPLKACSYDCVYCQLGRTTHKTVRRRDWVDPAQVVAQVRDQMDTKPDIITIAGSGEPTLAQGIGEVIAGIKESTDIPVAVLTNGSLLGLPALQRELASADVVIPSLDAPDERLFQLVNRQHRSLRLEDVVGGLVAFRESYRGQLWLEVLLLGGVTGIPEEVARLATLAERIAPDRIQLNTVVRPPAESFAQAVPFDRLQEYAAMFTPHAEVIAPAVQSMAGFAASRADVMALVSRRPCNVADIAAGLGIHRSEALKIVMALVDDGQVETVEHGAGLFFQAAHAVIADTVEERS